MVKTKNVTARFIDSTKIHIIGHMVNVSLCFLGRCLAFTAIFSGFFIEVHKTIAGSVSQRPQKLLLFVDFLLQEAHGVDSYADSALGKHGRKLDQGLFKVKVRI